MDFKTFARLIIIDRTVFALPFAYIGIVFAGGGDLSVWLWCSVALFAARTAGMSFNRAIDAKIDAANPRTASRLIPCGQVKRSTAWLMGFGASGLLVLSSRMLNSLCFYLSFPAVFLLITYSYTKRFSAVSHFYLGLVEAAAPIGGYLAVTGEFSLIPFILGLVILMWIAGLDIVYALQDQEFDSAAGLHSAPVALGIKKATNLSALCYIFSVAALVLAGVLSDREAPFWIMVFCICLIFVYQQKIARRELTPAVIREFFPQSLQRRRCDQGHPVDLQQSLDPV